MTNWKTFKIGDPSVASIILGQSPPSETYNAERRGLPFFQGKADFGARFPKLRVWCSSPSKRAQPGDVLMSVRAPVGDVNVADVECAIGRGIAAIRPIQIDPDFLFYALMYAKPRLEAHGTGSIFAAINRSVLEGFDIPAPADPREQKAIAKILRDLQESVELQVALSERYAELKAATMAKLFSEGLRGEPLKTTDIGPIPETWEVTRLGDVARITTGTTPSTERADYYIGRIPFVKTAEIDNRIIWDTDVHVSDLAVSDYRLKLYPAGTVLLAMYGQGKTRGRAALLGVAATTTQNTAAIECTDRLRALYLWHHLLSRYDDLRRMGNLGHLSHLNLGYVKDLLIPLPGIKEQVEIGESLDLIHRNAQVARDRGSVLEQLFQLTLHELMTGEAHTETGDVMEATNA